MPAPEERDAFVGRLALLLGVAAVTVVAATMAALALPSVQERFLAERSPVAYVEGDTIDIDPLMYRSSPRTIFLFSRFSCGACQASKPVVAGIVADLAGRLDAQVILVTGEALPEDERLFALRGRDRAVARFSNGLEPAARTPGTDDGRGGPIRQDADRSRGFVDGERSDRCRSGERRSSHRSALSHAAPWLRRGSFRLCPPGLRAGKRCDGRVAAARSGAAGHHRCLHPASDPAITRLVANARRGAIAAHCTLTADQAVSPGSPHVDSVDSPRRRCRPRSHHFSCRNR